jgi:hypothetical protein
MSIVERIKSKLSPQDLNDAEVQGYLKYLEDNPNALEPLAEGEDIDWKEWRNPPLRVTAALAKLGEI